MESRIETKRMDVRTSVSSPLTGFRYGFELHSKPTQPAFARFKLMCMGSVPALFLFYDDHLTCCGIVTTGEHVEVDAAGNSFADIVATIPVGGFIAFGVAPTRLETEV